MLNGAPRSGKTSIARAIQAAAADPWINLGVDLMMQATPERLLPGMGLRPGGERPDLEPFVIAACAALYDSVGAHARHGLNVVVDVGHHDSYSQPLGILRASVERLAGLEVFVVGVRCPLEVILERRAGTWGAESNEGPGAARWSDAVHQPGIYDLEIDTSTTSPEAAAVTILARLREGPPGDAARRIVAS